MSQGRQRSGVRSQQELSISQEAGHPGSGCSVRRVPCTTLTLGALVVKLKLQYFGHLMQRTDSLEKTLMLEKIESGRRRGRQGMRWLDGITDSMDMSLSNSGSW